MANALLIWDNNKGYVANTFSKELGISYPDDCVFSFEKLKQNKFVSAKDAIVVLLETDLDGKKRTENFGLEIVKYLRKEIRYKGLIVVYSTMTEQQIQKEVKCWEILFTPGTILKVFNGSNILNEQDIINLSEVESPISDLCLDDIIYFVIDSKGRIDELCHNLKNDLTKAGKQDFLIDQFKENCLKEILYDNIDELNKIIKNLKNDLKTKLSKNNTYFDVINKYKLQIVTLLPTSDENNDEATNKSTTENVNWQVIYLEDDEQVATEVEFYFKENGVTCHIATSETEAKQKLDDYPNVTLFITDIRLKDKSGKWHKHQGYDVIAQIANHSKMPLIFAVLTSKKGSIINSAKQKLQHQIFWENKDNVLHCKQAFDIYFNRLKELGDENFVSNTAFKVENFNKIIDSKKYKLSLEEFYYSYKKQTYSKYIEYEDVINKYTFEKIFKGSNLDKQWASYNNSELIGENELNFFKDKLISRRFLLSTIFKNSKLTSNELDNLIFYSINKNVPYDNKKLSDFKKNLKRHLLFKDFKKLIKNITDYHLKLTNNAGILIEEYNFLLKNDFIKNHINEHSIDIYNAIEEYEVEYNKTIDNSLLKEIYTVYKQIASELKKHRGFIKQKHYVYLTDSFENSNNIAKNILVIFEKIIIDIFNYETLNNCKIILNEKLSIKNHDLKNILKKYEYLK